MVAGACDASAMTSQWAKIWVPWLLLDNQPSSSRENPWSSHTFPDFYCLSNFTLSQELLDRFQWNKNHIVLQEMYFFATYMLILDLKWKLAILSCTTVIYALCTALHTHDQAYSSTQTDGTGFLMCNWRWHLMHDNMALTSGATLELIRILTKIWSICHFDMIPLTHLTTQVMIGEKPHCPNCCQQRLIPGGFLTSGVISFFFFLFCRFSCCVTI